MWDSFNSLEAVDMMKIKGVREVKELVKRQNRESSYEHDWYQCKVRVE